MRRDTGLENEGKRVGDVGLSFFLSLSPGLERDLNSDMRQSDSGRNCRCRSMLGWSVAVAGDGGGWRIYTVESDLGDENAEQGLIPTEQGYDAHKGRFRTRYK